MIARDQLEWRFPCRLERVIDGDTASLELDCGFGITLKHTFRLHGINTPEMKGDTHEAGRRAQRELMQLCVSYPRLAVVTHKSKTDKYGRYVAELWGESDDPLLGPVCFNDELVRRGFAEKVPA